MTQTSQTKSVATSLLKHLIGHPLGTATPPIDPCEGSKAPASVVPQPLSGTIITRPKCVDFCTGRAELDAPSGLSQENKGYPCNLAVHFDSRPHWNAQTRWRGPPSGQSSCIDRTTSEEAVFSRRQLAAVPELACGAVLA